jgi:hypothetical protein
MEGGTSDRKLDEFEKLIRDAIVLLIERGEISISRKKPSPSKTELKEENSRA